jgi:hypothetical protein
MAIAIPSVFEEKWSGREELLRGSYPPAPEFDRLQAREQAALMFRPHDATYGNRLLARRLPLGLTEPR